MKRTLILTAAMIAVCAVTAVLVAAPAAGAGNQEQPLKGSCVASFVFAGENTLDLSGTCHLTHLGLTTWTAVQTLSVGLGGEQVIVNDTTYRAANGDVLYGHFVGTGTQVDPMSLAFTGGEQYTGGTGRFAGVSGYSDLTGGATFAGFVPVPFGTGFWTTSGEIGY